MKRALFFVVIVAGLILAAQVQADAAGLRLNDLGTSGVDVECFDGDVSSALCPGGDQNATVGVITYIGIAGGFTTNVTTVVSKPVIGSTDFARLDLNDVSISGGAGTLRIQATDTGFTGPISGGLAGPFRFEVGGTTDGSVNFTSYLDDSNTAFGIATPLCALSGFGSCEASLAAAGTFSLTIRADIVHGAGTNITSFNAELSPEVAEPASLLYGLGLGLVALAGSRKRLFVAA